VEAAAQAAQRALEQKAALEKEAQTLEGEGAGCSFKRDVGIWPRLARRRPLNPGCPFGDRASHGAEDLHACAPASLPCCTQARRRRQTSVPRAWSARQRSGAAPLGRRRWRRPASAVRRVWGWGVGVGGRGLCVCVVVCVGGEGGARTDACRAESGKVTDVRQCCTTLHLSLITVVC
jgi:hypothetical protein